MAVPVVSDAVAVVVLRQGPSGWQTLLLKREHPPLSWSQPGGRIVPGETAAQAARRELREETGLDATDLYTADWNEMFYEPAPDRISLFPVFVAIVDAAQPVRLSPQHSDLRWCTPAEAMDLVAFPGQRLMLRHVVAEFIDRVPHPLMAVD